MNLRVSPQTTLEGAFIGTPRRQLFASRDMDETRALVSQVMKPHRLAVDGRAQRVDSRMYHAEFGQVSLSRLKYGAPVQIQPGALDDFYLVQMPVAGSALIESGSQSVDSSPQVASVLSPSEPTTMRWAGDTEQLMVRIGRAVVERMLAAQVGRAIDAPPVFQLAFRWRDCEAWRCLLSYLADCATHDLDLSRHQLMTAHIEQLVAATLLSAHAHDVGQAPAPRRTMVLPRHVRKVEEYLQGHAHEPIYADQLAAVAGVSLRSLFTAFRQFKGVSPMQYLKELRLERARADLLLGCAGISTVAGVALRWGFAHVGRFSTEYKQRFGESPGETLRRA